MKRITVKNIETFINTNDLENISMQMDDLQSNSIANQPWEEYRTDNTANFSIAYNSSNIILKFYVWEQNLKASTRAINGDVHHDNCVEFFIAFEKEYYNIEINCLGNIKVGYGLERDNRKLLPENIISKIKTHIVLGSDKVTDINNVYWEILMIIPKDLFCYSEIETFKGKKCRANFYKCGDELPDPHFLTWSMIYTTEPDFHQREFFGELIFD